MAGEYQDDLMEELDSAITAAQASMLVADFTIQIDFFPEMNLEDLPTSGQLWILGLGTDETLMSRGMRGLEEIPIQFNLQKLISDGDRSAEIRKYVKLSRQIRDKCRANFTLSGGRIANWMRTESLKDENGTPYNYIGLRQLNLFEAIWTSTYKVVS